MLLEGKVAIVYGGAGAIGSAVARMYAVEGASVHLVGRTRESLEHVAAGIPDAGGRVEVDQLDATDRVATGTLLHRRPRLEDVAHAAAFLASDRAPTMTATEVNITGGAVID